MKKITIIAMSVLMFSACIAPNKNDTKVEVRESLKRIDTFPNGTTAYNQLDWEQVLVDTTGEISYLGLNSKGQGEWMKKDSTWKKAIVIPRNVYWLTMPSKMVKHFMKVSDYFSKPFVLATILSILIVFAAYKFLHDDLIRLAGKGAIGIYVVALLAVPFRMYQKRPSELADLNVKQLSKAEFDYWEKIDPTFEKFWKEKWERNELVSLSNK